MTNRWWHALSGGCRFAKALASGDRASTLVMASRLEICGRCPTRTVKRETWLALFGGPRSGWCGEPFTPVKGKACGCLVMAEAVDGAAVVVTINGRKYEPAGKSIVGTAKCPAGRW